MNPDIQALINAIGGFPQAGNELFQPNTLMPDTNAGQNQNNFGLGQTGMGANPDQTILGGASNASPLNFNPTFADTVKSFFENNPMAQQQSFSHTPIAPGPAGNNSNRMGGGWHSFMGNDPNSIMQAIINA